MPTHLSLHTPIDDLAEEAGTTVSFWRLGEQITGGRWFHLFRAAPKSMSDRSAYDYVVKMINPDLDAAKTALAVDRMGREAAATDKVAHHGVIPLIDAELDNAPFFLVQPWFSGGSLDRYLATADNVSLIRCLWIVRQVVETINAAHERGRAHLGIEPAHLLMGSGGRITLIGWSQSHHFGEKIENTSDQMQMLSYTAPEGVYPGAKAEAANDIYSLGVLIYRLLAGKTPFQASTPDMLIQRQQQWVPIPLLRESPVCPAAVSSLVTQMLSKDPAARPTLRDVLDLFISIEIENLENPALIQL